MLTLILATLTSLYEPVTLPPEAKIAEWRSMIFDRTDSVVPPAYTTMSGFREDANHTWKQTGEEYHSLTNFAFCKAGETDYDEEMRALISKTRVSAATWAEACYGPLGMRQLVRAIYERAKAYREDPGILAGMCAACPQVMPCAAPGVPLAFYSITSRLWPKLGCGNAVPITGQMIVGTAANSIDIILAAVSRAIPRSRIMPTSIALCRANDDAHISYALPLVGVVIHQPNAYAHELAHFFNPPAVRSPNGWAEFLPAYHALKVHAFRAGIDLGAPGGWKVYYSRFGSLEKVRELSTGKTVSGDGVELLSRVVAGDTAVAELCANDGIGRLTL